MTAARIRCRATGPARSVGAATERAASTTPSPPSTGAPTDTTPTRLSSRFSAHPRTAISRSRARSVASSTIVYGVTRWGVHARSRTSSSSGGNEASRTLPVLVVGAGRRVPTWAKIRTVCGLSRRSTYTDSHPSSTASWTVSPVEARSIAIAGRAASCRSSRGTTLAPRSNTASPSR